MDKGIRKPAATPDIDRVSLGELIHHHMRVAIEAAVHEELHGALGARRSRIARGCRRAGQTRRRG
jgi:hypothetical protein